jgi:thiamine kinase-like enzyme
MEAVPAVDDLVARVARWAGHAVTWAPLPGGLSHHIYRVDVDGGAGCQPEPLDRGLRSAAPAGGPGGAGFQPEPLDRGLHSAAPAGGPGGSYVLRVLQPAVSAAGLGIPPEREIENTLIAAEAGVGARVVEVLPDVPALVLEFIAGRTLGAADVRDPALAAPIAAACRQLHAGGRFANDFDIFGKRAELLALCRRHDLALPAGYHDHDAAVRRLRAALAVDPPATVPCHNDLLAENFILDVNGLDANRSVRIIDYQLAGNNDPAFELGDIAAEADFDADQVGRLTAAYFGPERSDALMARVRLNLIASNITWTLWFAVHCGLLADSDRHGSGFDYAGEAAEKWGQAVRDLTAPDFGRLLDAAAGRRPAAYPS